MPRVWVDKQTRTTSAIKKYVDNPYLIWFAYGKEGRFLWKTRLELTRPADFHRGEGRAQVQTFDCADPANGFVRAGFLVLFCLSMGYDRLLQCRHL
jgi:hypothetical protein